MRQYRAKLSLKSAVLPLLGSLALGPMGCGQPTQSMPHVAKVGTQVAPQPAPAPTSLPPADPTAAPNASAATVEQAVDKGCTTQIVRGLSEQIIAEGNCLHPNAFERIPRMTNLVLDAAVFPYLAAGARDALVKALNASKSTELKLNSALRTVAQQYLLYRWYRTKRCGITLAARPGKSNHESGLAIDISKPKSWRRKLRKVGFRWKGKKDRWHFDYRGKRVKKRKGGDVKAFQRLWNRNHPDDQIGEDGDYGQSTEKRLRKAPPGGFPLGASCSDGP